LSHHAPELPAVPVPTPAPSIPSREPSLLRGRAVNTASGRGGSSSRSQTPAASAPKLNTLDGGPLERKPSGNYGHHRQASVVHGNIQHSRNTSFSSTPTTSPLTPHIIAEAGITGQHAIDSRMMAEDEVGRLPTLNGHTVVGPKGHSPSTSFGDRLGMESTPAMGFRRPERMYSGRTRKEHNHTRSQSRGLLPHQQVTVGEYALHHLFNSVSSILNYKVVYADSGTVYCARGTKDRPVPE
jgi:hypothetical protein